MLWARAAQRRTGWFVTSAGVGVAFTSDAAPTAAVALDHLVGFLRSERARLVVREVRRRPRGPRVDERVDDAPCLLDLVGPGEQRGVTLERIEDEGLVRVG